LKELCAHFGVTYDYQLLQRFLTWKYEDAMEPRKIVAGAHMLQSLTKNFFTRAEGQRCKKFRRRQDPMPVQVRSGYCFTLGDFGSRGGTHGQAKSFYNCQVQINGLKIRGRLPGRAPEGRVLEGVSLTKKADGWWASIKQEVPIRAVPTAIPDTIVGIDVGLVNLVALSEVRVVKAPDAEVFHKQGSLVRGSKGRAIPNPRGALYAERIAGRQAQGKPVGRLQLAEGRHLRHLIHNEIIKPLGNVETIKVEQLQSHIGQMGSSKTSAMRTVVSLLRQRYGSRVREVKPHHTSQECSKCGFRSKESWSYDHGRYGECPQCGHKEDRDVNAARNIAAKPVIPVEE
jgi:putative transposase